MPPRDASAALVIAAIVYGATARLWPAFTHDFPVETGGLFYVFIKDILAQHGGLPVVTTYNGGLPFAYPPLSFYVAAGLCQLSGADPLTVLRFLPSVCAALTVPAVWLLARRLVSPLAAAWATVAFAIVPGDLLLIEGGGGLPRAMGLLLAVLGLEATVALRHAPGLPKRTILRVGALLASAAACHPEIALFAFASAALLYLCELPRAWLLRGLGLSVVLAGLPRGWFLRGLGLSVVVGGLTASWLLPELIRHGLATYQGASTQPAAYGFIGGVGYWLRPYSLTGEFALPAVQMAALFGAVVAVRRRALWLPLWVVGIIVLDQRAPILVLPVPVALVAGYGIAEGIVPVLRGSGAPLLRVSGPRLVVVRRLALAALPIPLLLSALYTFVVVFRVTSSVSPEEFDAMRWAADRTPAGSNFLVVPDPGRLFVSEWFPAIADRRSIVTHEGTEWLGAATFAHTVHDFDAVQACYAASVACLERWQQSTGRSFDYLLISRDVPLAATLDAAPDYELVYASNSQAIYRHQPVMARDNETPD